ncbi:MAG: SDR family NAD(P)-dependent oxidoreductase [Myxococcota bacterium]
MPSERLNPLPDDWKHPLTEPTERLTNRLSDKVAIVTGAASGIGAATTRRFISEGARVVLVDRETAGLDRAVAEHGNRVTGCPGDVSQESTIEAAVDAAIQNFGRLDVIHNNAAAAFDEDAGTATTPDFVWKGTFDLVVMAAIWSCRHGIPVMRRTGGGSIINMSTGAARVGIAARSAYAVSKGALESLTIHTATQYGVDGIRCNAVAPGFVLTETTAKYFDEAALTQFENSAASGRICRPEDVADVVAFLASDDSRYVSGQILTVDGGGSRGVSF